MSVSQDCSCTECSYADIAAVAPVGPMTTGVKGSDVYTDLGVGNPLVALNTKLVRGANTAGLQAAIAEILEAKSDALLTDAIVMAFQARDVRGGKGERKVFQDLFLGLYEKKPELATALIDLIPEYGSWDDVFTIGSWALKNGKAILLAATFDLFKKQLHDDEAAVADGETAPSISLMAKWAPREGKQFGGLAAALANDLAGPEKCSSGLKHSQIMADYRKRLSKLNRYLKTVETYECSNRWDEIDPKKVPARAREIKKAAYLNEKAPGKHGRSTGELRRPADEKRMACRKHFQEFFAAAAAGKVKISGADTLYPHEIVKKAERAQGEDECNSLDAVWKAMVAKAAAGGGLGKSVFMCDFSGSMNGLPMEVSKAMGLLGCAVCSGPFRGRFLTFHEKPAWNVIDPDQPLTTQVQQFDPAWGGTTDFQAAGEMILAELKSARAPPGSAPENLIVVTDMGFDQACGSYETSAYSGASYRHNVKTEPKQTQAQMLREAFRRASEDVHGDPNAWAAPRIVIWNVAAHYSDNHQATATEEGVLTLSGWSPSLFKVLCAEGPRAITPLEVLRQILDDKRYDRVRCRVRQWLEGGWRGI